MKILIVVDQQKYSDFAALEAARLAVNTWSDATILGIESTMSQTGEGPDEGLVEAVCRYRNYFIKSENNIDSPYNCGECGVIKEIRPRLWEMENSAVPGKKQLRVLIRKGVPIDEILHQAKEDDSDFIVIGSSSSHQTEWTGSLDLPQKIANNAPCSVLVVKEEKNPKTVMCCLDHDNVSQESLELINQLVTLHQADLKIVGMTAAKGLKEEVEVKMNQILNYYTSRGIKAWIRLVTAEDLEGFVAQAAKQSLVGLWLGKKSFLQKIFSQDRISQLISAANSSLLILK